MSEVFRADEALAGQRADKAVTLLMPQFSRAQAQRLLALGAVTIAGVPRDKNYRIRPGDVIEATLPQPEPDAALPQNIPLDIVYEDGDLLVVDKPRGMVVHPGAGNPDGTLVNALLAHCGDSLSGIGGVKRPGIVHRIDKNTSGLLIVAKNDFAHRRLAAQIKAHSFTRVYEAVLIGHLREDEGTVDAPIGRDPSHRTRMAVTQKNSRSAVTHYRVILRYPGFTHAELRLETGRTHQIRVHMAYLGHPVAGDDLYGPRRQDYGLNGQCLHARTIGFIHPRTSEYLQFTSPLPAYFTAFLAKISKT